MPVCTVFFLRPGPFTREEEISAPSAGNVTPPPGLRPVCMRYVAVSCPKNGCVIERMIE